MKDSKVIVAINKDPTQNIVWVTPEGGGGPNYPNL
jgi:hypothetical protein